MGRFGKLLLFALIFVFAAGMMAGCGQQASPDGGQKSTPDVTEKQAEAKEQTAPETVELTLLDDCLENLNEAEFKAFNQEIKEFMKEHPEVNIIRDSASADVVRQKIPTLAAANELPDMFTGMASIVPNFVNAGIIMSVEELFSDRMDYLDGFIPGMLDDYLYKGSHYGIPQRSMPVYVMYFNMGLLKESGIEKAPETFEELLAAIKATKAKGLIPLVLGDKGKWPSRLLFSGLGVRTAGGDYLEKIKAGELKFTDPSVLKALQYIEEISKAGAFNKDFTSIDHVQARALFYDKKAAMYGECLFFSQVEDDEWPEDIKNNYEEMFIPQLPGEDLSNGVTVPVAADIGLVFSSKLKNDPGELKAAQAFAMEVMGADYNKKIAEFGSFPVMKVTGADLSNVPEAIKRYNDKLAPKLLTGCHTDGRLPDAVLEAITVNLQNLIIGSQTAEQSAEKIQAVMEKSMSK